MPLGETALTQACVMFNWIGEFPPRDRLLSLPGLHWHDYGKAPRPGRKIGHATLTAPSGEALMTRAAEVAEMAGGAFPALLERLD